MVSNLGDWDDDNVVTERCPELRGGSSVLDKLEKQTEVPARGLLEPWDRVLREMRNPSGLRERRADRGGQHQGDDLGGGTGEAGGCVRGGA